jgi:hypothetical protein
LSQQLESVLDAREETTMTLNSNPRPTSSGRPTVEYKLIFIASYPLFLCGALLRRMTHAERSAGTPRSVFAEARQDVHVALPYAF